MKMEMILYVYGFLPKSCENGANDAGKNLTCYRKTDSKLVTPMKGIHISLISKLYSIEMQYLQS